jgi:hypothetical protein
MLIRLMTKAGRLHRQRADCGALSIKEASWQVVSSPDPRNRFERAGTPP